MEFVSGESRNQITLMPDSIDDYVDDNNSVRVIDAYINSLNLADLDFTCPQPHDTGRPMYDPKDLLKLYVYGYMNRIRSSRRLETETKRNLEIIWLLRKLSPDHKTIARFRHDNTVALKNVFRDFVKLCVKLNLYGKELIAIDGSKFKAVNSKDRNFTKKKLQERIARIDVKIEEYLRELEDSDLAENASAGEKSAEEIAQIITDLAARKELYQAYAQELVQTDESQKSLTDPDSRLMMGNGKMDVYYNVQTSVDAKNKLIAEFEVTNNATDNNQITPMAKITKEILGTDQLTAVIDTGYDSVQDIIDGMNQDVDVHVAGTNFDVCVPADEQSETEITTHKDGRCVYFADRNIALCPMGKVLYPGFYKKTKGHGVFYNYKACRQCVCKCTKEPQGRRHQVPMPEAAFSKVYDDKDLFVRQIRIAPDKKLSVKERPS
jgi:transposase